MAPHQPTKLNHKLMWTLHRVAEIPHVNLVGTYKKKARGIHRPFGRGVEERECPSTTAVVAGPHIQDTTSAVDILLRLIRHNHIHALNRISAAGPLRRRWAYSRSEVRDEWRPSMSTRTERVLAARRVDGP
jgi:hypothetical protein